MPKVDSGFQQMPIESLLNCGHSVLYRSAPNKGDVVLCVRCDDYVRVKSPGRSINKSRSKADT